MIAFPSYGDSSECGRLTLDTAYEPTTKKTKKMKGLKSRKSSSISPTRSLTMRSSIDPANFLMKGGVRATEHETQLQLRKLSTFTINELKQSNSVLSDELQRLRSDYSGETSALRDELSKVCLALQAEQANVEKVRVQLGEEQKLRGELEDEHHARLKELQRRLRDENALRTGLEGELLSVKAMYAAMQQQVIALEAESAKLNKDKMQTEAEKSRLEAQTTADTAMLAEYRARITALETKLEAETTVKSELMVKCSNLEVQQRTGQDAQAKLLQAQDRLMFVEAEAQQVASIRQQLAELQASLVQASADKVRLDKVTTEHSQQLARLAVLESEVESLRAQTEEARLQREEADSRCRQTQQLMDAMQKDCLVLRQERDALKQHAASTLKEREETLRAESQAQIALLQAKIGEQEHDVQQVKAALKAKEDALSVVQAQSEVWRQREEDARERARTMTEKCQALAVDCDTLRQQLEIVKGELARHEEALASSNAQLELWRKEATEVAQTAARLRQQLGQAEAQAQESEAELQKQLDGKCKELEMQELKSAEYREALRTACARTTTQQSVMQSDQLRFDSAVKSLETKLASATEDAASARMGLQAAVAAKEAAMREAAQQRSEAERLASKLHAETAAVMKSQSELTALQTAHMRELEAKSTNLAEVMAALRNEERLRTGAQQEVRTLKQAVHTLETELSTAQEALAAAVAARQQAEEDCEDARVTLHALQRTTRHYKRENKTILHNYDAWINSLVNRTSPRSPNHHQTPPRATTAYARTVDILNDTRRASSPGHITSAMRARHQSVPVSPVGFGLVSSMFDPLPGSDNDSSDSEGEDGEVGLTLDSYLQKQAAMGIPHSSRSRKSISSHSRSPSAHLYHASGEGVGGLDPRVGGPGTSPDSSSDADSAFTCGASRWRAGSPPVCGKSGIQGLHL